MMVSSGMLFVPRFIEFHHLIQKLLGSRHIHLHGHDNISLSFPINKKIQV